ncbi:MAG: ribonuclease H family protein [Clostridiales bacterium]|jgi:viroplasmin and RNaseH domain-containing protein|nr:ribonuclease H family protein [Clostridiales bacterium]
MVMKKFYAVKAGRETGIFDSWEKCKKSVIGFPNAVYKSFTTLEQAEDYMYGNTIKTPETETNNPDEIVAYIDGSYSEVLNKYSYAVILFVDGEKIVYSNSENNPVVSELRNVAGELKAAMYAMLFTNRHNKKSLRLYYDYAGIEMWATGQWKAKTHLTKSYAEYADKMKKQINITFVKVAAHTGNIFNEEADRFAKAALHKTGKDLSRTSNLEPLTESNQEIDKSVNDIFSIVKGKTAGVNLNILLENGLIITDEELFRWAKVQWKAEKLPIKHIRQLKAYYDVKMESFVIGVFSDKDERVYKVRSSEWNG